jgi:hypothetical protein
MKARHMCGVLVSAAIVLATGAVSAQDSGQTTTRASMRGLFVTLTSVYKYSLDAVAFEDKKNHAEILGKLEALAQNADQLESHGGGLDPSFDFMRRSLSRDAHDALQGFKTANYVGSRFVINEITQNCVTCHTKLPAERTFESGKEFMDAIKDQELPPAALARLQVASRQFADAMQTYEMVMRDPQYKDQDLATFNTFENYFRISIGAMADTKRPAATLREFVKREDMPESVKNDAGTWAASLEVLKLDTPKGDELAAGRRMVTDAMAGTKSRSDRSRLVDYIASITLVHRYLRTGPTDAANLAEAYYLLGVAESYASYSYWISEANYLLERSIRTAPKSPVAKQALAFLDEYRRSGYATPARAVPEGQTSIEELRKLTEQ